MQKKSMIGSGTERSSSTQPEILMQMTAALSSSLVIKGSLRR